LPRTVVQLRDRLGCRPTDGARRRRLAGELLLDDSPLSLRQAARETGLSPETVRTDLVADEDRPAAGQRRGRIAPCTRRRLPPKIMAQAASITT
jgi:hypothetical protein